MITVKQVLDAAIHILDEQSEMDGTTIGIDTVEFMFRTPSLINTILPMLYLYDSSRGQTEDPPGSCPLLVLPEDPAHPNLEQEIPLDVALASGVLPYALAGHLISSQDEALSQWCMNRYHEALVEIRNRVPAEFKPIFTPYGLF